VLDTKGGSKRSLSIVVITNIICYAPSENFPEVIYLEIAHPSTLNYRVFHSSSLKNTSYD